MQKFTESVKFIPDPSIIKKYASYIIPLYLTREIKCDTKLIDEYLEMYQGANFEKNTNMISDLEILAVKNIFDDPLTSQGFQQIKNDLHNKSAKLEMFLRKNLPKHIS